MTWLILGIRLSTSLGSASQSFPPVKIAVGIVSCVTLYGGGEGYIREKEWGREKVKVLINYIHSTLYVLTAAIYLSDDYGNFIVKRGEYI